MFKIHKSTIQDYVLCPRRMKAIWLDNIQPAQPEIAYVGQQFHKLVAEWFDVVEWSELKKRKALDDVRKYMMSCFPKNVHPLVTPLLVNFVEYETMRYVETRAKGKLYFYPLEKEFYVETEHFAGTIDAIFKATKRRNAVHEWKTGNSFNRTSLRRELAFYSVMLNATQYKGTIGYISYYNPNINKYMFEKLNKNSVNAVLRWIKKIEHSIKTDTWPRRIGVWCRGCPIYRKCLLEFAQPFEEVSE